jgi:ATP-dependent exoDNAse (exonuclease V) beta subunit
MNIDEELKVFKRITYIEDNHQYLIDGLPTYAPSVTRLLSRHKPEFDSDAAAAHVAKKERVTPEYIKAKWAENNLYSTTIGTLLHKHIENFYCKTNEKCNVNVDELTFDNKKLLLENLPKLVKQFEDFYKDNPHLEYVRSELILGDVNDTKICGTCDMLVYNKLTNQYDILDFKTNKKMENKSKYKKRLLYPFEHMDACQVNEYTIQLNTYEYFLSKNTSINIGRKVIVWFNANNDTYKAIPVYSIQDKIKEMFRQFKTSSLFVET